MTSASYVRADDRNLPHVDLYMMLEFVKNSPDFDIFEVRGHKASHSTRAAYVDSAVGWVQVCHRTDGSCHLKAKICPEHKISQTLYDVEAGVNVDKIEYIKCLGCTAGDGGCKHAIAFLMWLYTKSNTPSVTQVQCYWKKPKLKKGSSAQIITLKDFRKPNDADVPGAATVASMFLNNLTNKNAVLFARSCCTEEFASLDMHFLGITFMESVPRDKATASKFLEYIATQADPLLCAAACEATEIQSGSPLWHTLRYGRITGSVLYEAAHAKDNQSLPLKILGASKVPLTPAIDRGKRLEEPLRKEVCAQRNVNFKTTGFWIVEQCPHFGVSPDGISDDCVLEMKCPFKESTVKNYIKNDGTIKSSVRAQLQLQMGMCKRSKGLLAVADPNFENNKKILFVEDTFDPTWLHNQCCKAELYWIEHILPKLVRNWQ